MREALGQLGTIKVAGPDGIELEVDLRRADEGTIARDLSELFLQLGQAAGTEGYGCRVLARRDPVRRRGRVPLGDQRASPSDAEEPADHARGRRAAADPAADRRSAVLRRAAVHASPSSPTSSRPTHARRSCSRPASIGVEYDASKRSNSRSSGPAGYPFFIQQLGKHAWNLAQGHRSRPTMSRPRYRRPSRAGLEHLRGSIQRATHEERRYMRAMAELGDGPYKSGAVARSSDAGRRSLAASPAPPRQGPHLRHRGLRSRRLHRPAVRRLHGRHMPYKAPRARQQTDRSDYREAGRSRGGPGAFRATWIAPGSAMGSLRRG